MHAHALQALEFMHSKGIVHGDLKPENIVSSSEGGDDEGEAQSAGGPGSGGDSGSKGGGNLCGGRARQAPYCVIDLGGATRMRGVDGGCTHETRGRRPGIKARARACLAGLQGMLLGSGQQWLHLAVTACGPSSHPLLSGAPAPPYAIGAAGGSSGGGHSSGGPSAWCTPAFASRASLRGEPALPADDAEALLSVMLWLATGQLPWWGGPVQALGFASPLLAAGSWGWYGTCAVQPSDARACCV